MLSLFPEQLRGQSGWSRVNEGTEGKLEAERRCLLSAWWAKRCRAYILLQVQWGAWERNTMIGLHFEYISSNWGTSAVLVNKKLAFLWPISCTPILCQRKSLILCIWTLSRISRPSCLGSQEHYDLWLGFSQYSRPSWCLRYYLKIEYRKIQF